MVRAHFTVALRNGQRYDANHIGLARRWGDNAPVLTFLSSGHSQEFHAEDVVSVEYHPPRPDLPGDYCSECDQAI